MAKLGSSHAAADIAAGVKCKLFTMQCVGHPPVQMSETGSELESV